MPGVIRIRVRDVAARMPRRATAVLATAAVAGAVLALPLLFRRRRPASPPDLALDPGEVRDEDEAYYELQNRPAWAPPGWAFPVAWTTVTVCLAAATQYVGFRQNLPRRRELLTYLALHYGLYATFSRVYFDERSPVLGAAWTTADFAVCHLAFYRALGVDGRVAWAFVPANLWLTLAVPLSLYQAAANPDRRYGTFGIETGEIIAGALGVSPIHTGVGPLPTAPTAPNRAIIVGDVPTQVVVGPRAATALAPLG